MRKATGSYCTYSIPGKTAALVPALAVKDLHLGRISDDNDDMLLKQALYGLSTKKRNKCEPKNSNLLYVRRLRILNVGEISPSSLL